MLGFTVNDDELKEALVELSSPLVNWLEKRDNQYKLIFSEEFLQNQQRRIIEVLKWLH